MNAEFQRIARRDKKAFFSDQCKDIEENNRRQWRNVNTDCLFEELIKLKQWTSPDGQH